VDSILLDLFKTKYERGAKTPGTHDCKCLFVEVMHRYGNPIKVSDIEVLAVEEVVAAMARKEYPYTDVDAAVIEKELQSGKWKKIEIPVEGCAVVIALDSDKPNLIQHLGVYVGENKFIHILEEQGVITTRIDDRFFRRKIRGFYEWNP